jgi:hypothetical protein
VGLQGDGGLTIGTLHDKDGPGSCLPEGVELYQALRGEVHGVTVVSLLCHCGDTGHNPHTLSRLHCRVFKVVMFHCGEVLSKVTNLQTLWSYLDFNIC